MKFSSHNIFPTLALTVGCVAAPALAESPYTQPDGTWINLSGTVESVTTDSFLLNYDGGSITVEMDDGDRDADGYKLVRGDRVTVSGAVDDDFFGSDSIEASSVYVENINTYFYASAIDDEDPFVPVAPILPSVVQLQGTVTAIGVDDFTIDTGARKITIEVDEMGYDPLDDEGYQKIVKGERVRVGGHYDVDLFENHSFEADYIVSLQNNGRS